MFEEIFFPPTAAKHCDAPLADQRARYLVQLKESGASRATLRKYANAHLNLVRLLDVHYGDRISLQDIEAAATLWSMPRGRRCDRAATSKARRRFVRHCVDLAHHLGWVEVIEENCHAFNAELQVYEDWLRNEGGLSKATVESYCRAADHFLVRLEGMGATLDAIQMADIDRVIGEEHRRGTWSRRTLHDFAQRLRSFLGFAETRGWCRPGLAAGIIAPGYMADEAIPKGLRRNDVERLLASVQGKRRKRCCQCTWAG